MRFSQSCLRNSYFQGGRCLSSLKITFIAVSALIMIGTHVARAQSSDLSSNCGPSPLRGDIVISALRKLIAHRDLTDVAFIENALDTRFPIPGPLMDTGEHVLGSAMDAELGEFYTTESSDQLMVAIDIPGRLGLDSYLHDCVRIPERDFLSRIGGRFSLESGSSISIQESAGKNGTRILLAFGWNADDGMVTWIKLRQWR